MQAQSFTSPVTPLYHKWKVVNPELRILSSPIDDMPHWVKDHFLRNTNADAVCGLTFFYHPMLDVIVLNENHHSAKLYRSIITKYLLIGDKGRRELRVELTTDGLDAVRSVLDLLDYVVGERKKHGGYQL